MFADFLKPQPRSADQPLRIQQHDTVVEIDLPEVNTTAIEKEIQNFDLSAALKFLADDFLRGNLPQQQELEKRMAFEDCLQSVRGDAKDQDEQLLESEQSVEMKAAGG